VRASIAALAIFVTATGAFASIAQALPAGFWGVVPQEAPSLEHFQRLALGGVRSVRIPVGWNSVQPNESGGFDWSSVDQQVEAASRAGIDVLPFLANAPSWAVPSVWAPGPHHTIKTPAHLPVSGHARAGWTSFLEAAVARYGPSGTFWAENPTVPKRPIRTWQIWNEENFKYFVAKPNPAEYGKLVNASSAALRSADPGAKLVLGGMFADPREATYKTRPREAYFATEFLEQMFRKTPGIQSKFVGVALHPYARSYQLLTPQIEAVRTVLKQNHDANVGLWITEIGWSSEAPGGGDSFAKGLNGQAAQLKGAFTLLTNNQRRWRIQRVFWFSVDDQSGACNFCGGSGLFGPGFTAKPSWRAYVKFADGSAG
jgi:hypothetical protein